MFSQTHAHYHCPPDPSVDRLHTDLTGSFFRLSWIFSVSFFVPCFVCPWPRETKSREFVSTKKFNFAHEIEPDFRMALFVHADRFDAKNGGRTKRILTSCGSRMRSKFSFSLHKQWFSFTVADVNWSRFNPVIEHLAEK